MLGERGIYAVSHDLGTNQPYSKSYFFNDKTQVENIVEANFPWIFSMIKYLHSQLKLNLNHLERQDDTRYMMVSLQNQGLGDLKNA